MIKELTLTLIEAIRQNGGRSVFLGALIEQILAPIPSPLIQMSAGFILVPKDLSPFQAILQVIQKVSLPYSLGAALGSSLLYFLARFGGRAIVARFGRFFGLSLKHIDKFRSRFTRGFKDELIILLLLILPVTPISLVAASCGLIGIRTFEYYVLILIGVFLRTIFLGYLGWQMGETYESIAHGLDKTESLLSVGLVFVAFIILGLLYYKRQKVLKS